MDSNNLTIAVVILIFLVSLDILQRGRAAASIKNRQKEFNEKLERSFDEIGGYLKSFPNLEEKLKRVDFMDISLVSKDPISIEDQLFWLAQKISDVGFTSEKDDDTVKSINTFLSELFNVRITAVGQLTKTKKHLFVMEGTVGADRSKNYDVIGKKPSIPTRLNLAREKGTSNESHFRGQRTSSTPSLPPQYR